MTIITDIQELNVGDAVRVRDGDEAGTVKHLDYEGNMVLVDIPLKSGQSEVVDIAPEDLETVS